MGLFLFQFCIVAKMAIIYKMIQIDFEVEKYEKKTQCPSIFWAPCWNLRNNLVFLKIQIFIKKFGDYENQNTLKFHHFEKKNHLEIFYNAYLFPMDRTNKF